MRSASSSERLLRADLHQLGDQLRQPGRRAEEQPDHSGVLAAAGLEVAPQRLGHVGLAGREECGVIDEPREQRRRPLRAGRREFHCA
jgi:hypothetical protein